MSTVMDRPHRPAHQAPARSSSLSGTVGLLRLYLRRDRIVLPLWVLLLSIPLSTVYVGSTEAVYPTDADRSSFAASIMASPAQRALYGQIYNDSVGAVGIWKAGMFHVLIAVAVILTVIRHTRADEETGRSELIDSTAVGRAAGLTAALLLAGGASVLTGVIATAGLLTLDIPAAGSVAFGAALACSGLVFTAVAAVTRAGVAERPIRARRRVQRARGGVHAARGRRRRDTCGVPELAVPGWAGRCRSAPSRATGSRYWGSTSPSPRDSSPSPTSSWHAATSGPG